MLRSNSISTERFPTMVPIGFDDPQLGAFKFTMRASFFVLSPPDAQVMLRYIRAGGSVDRVDWKQRRTLPCVFPSMGPEPSKKLPISRTCIQPSFSGKSSRYDFTIIAMTQAWFFLLGVCSQLTESSIVEHNLFKEGSMAYHVNFCQQPLPWFCSHLRLITVDILLWRFACYL